MQTLESLSVYQTTVSIPNYIIFVLPSLTESFLGANSLLMYCSMLKAGSEIVKKKWRVIKCKRRSIRKIANRKILDFTNFLNFLFFFYFSTIKGHTHTHPHELRETNKKRTLEAMIIE